jgi:arsenate reductase (thioredoxin)
VRYVLFACNHNAGSSQRAQAFFELLAPDDVRVESAGSTPARQVWPEVVEAMREVGIGCRAQAQEAPARDATVPDWAVTMGCDDACPYVPNMVEVWNVPDPVGRPLGEVRAIRDAIEVHVRELVETGLDAIRSDRAAHQLRLETCDLLAMS